MNMGFAGRAAQYLLFNKKKTLVWMLSYAVMFYALIVITIISAASDMQNKELRENVGNSVIVQKVMPSDAMQLVGIQDVFYQNEVDAFSSHPSVRAYNAVGMDSGNLKNARPYSPDAELERQVAARFAAAGMEPDGCYVFGITDSGRFTLFSSAGFRLVEGSHIGQGDSGGEVALISRQLAEANGIGVGDTIEIGEPHYSNVLTGATLSLAVKGIFEYPDDAYLDGKLFSEHPANYIFMPGGVAGAFSFSYQPRLLTLYLDDAANIPGFVEDMRRGQGSEYDSGARGTYEYVYAWDEKWYASVSRPLAEVGRMASLSSAIAAVGAFLIILLACAMRLADKKHEIGVLLAMGETKGRLVLQILIEAAAPIVAAASAAAAAGLLTAGRIGQAMMGATAAETEAQLALQRGQAIWNNGGSYSIAYELQSLRTGFYHTPGHIDVAGAYGGLAALAAAGLALILSMLAAQAAWTLRKRPAMLKGG
jgi:putative ABC transport system permease protein